MHIMNRTMSSDHATSQILPTYKPKAPHFVRGEGCHLWDSEGKHWIDALAGIAVNGLGHNHPRLVAAIAKQAAEVLHVSNLYRHPAGEELAHKLCGLTHMDRVFFSNSGSEANECALKIARKAAWLHNQEHPNDMRGSHLVALKGGFHGRTLGSLSVTSTPRYREPFAPLLECLFVAPEDFAGLEEALSTHPAALILEPLQGEGGLISLSKEFLQGARELCNQHNVVLIHDEVQSGCGRTGTFLCAEAAGVQPDIVTLAKPLAGGLPMGATCVSEALGQILEPGDHGSTFGGGPLASCAALVFLDEYEKGLAQNITARGEQLTQGLDSLVASSDLLKERRGRGLMQGLVVPGRAAEFEAKAFEAGLLVGTSAGDVLRLVPPYVLTAEDTDSILNHLKTVLISMDTTS